jgi:hypothetical protein
MLRTLKSIGQNLDAASWSAAGSSFLHSILAPDLLGRRAAEVQPRVVLCSTNHFEM